MSVVVALVIGFPTLRLRGPYFALAMLSAAVERLALSARSMDLPAMETYLVRTVAGHFAASRVALFHRTEPEDPLLTIGCSQRLRGACPWRPPRAPPV